MGRGLHSLRCGGCVGLELLLQLPAGWLTPQRILLHPNHSAKGKIRLTSGFWSNSARSRDPPEKVRQMRRVLRVKYNHWL
jgi:hypothetical protein